MLSTTRKWFQAADYASLMGRHNANENAVPFYIATTLSNAFAAESVCDWLQGDKNFYCTYQWFRVGTVPQELDIYTTVAEKEMNGVLGCQLFIGLLPGRLGMATELGAAIACGKKVLLYGKSESDFWSFDGGHGNIFSFHPSVTRITGTSPVRALEAHFNGGPALV